MNRLSLISPEEIYKDIFPDKSKVNFQDPGCYSESVWNEILKNSSDELYIAELGSWFGNSSNCLASKLKRCNKKFKLVCVDTWLGSPEHFLQPDFYKPLLKLKNGYPQIYFDFLNTVKVFQNEDVIIPFINTTTAFLNVSRAFNLKYDYIVVDASHQYEDVLNDLNIAFELIKDGGFIYGDDYPWPGVNKAVIEFCNIKKINLYYNDGIRFVIKK